MTDETLEPPQEFTVAELIAAAKDPDFWLPIRVAVRGHLSVTSWFAVLTERPGDTVGILVSGPRLRHRLGGDIGGGGPVIRREEATIVGWADRSSSLAMFPVVLGGGFFTGPTESVTIHSTADDPQTPPRVVDLLDLGSPRAEKIEAYCFNRRPSFASVIGFPDEAYPEVLIRAGDLASEYENARIVQEWASLVDEKDLVGRASSVRCFLEAALSFYERTLAEHGLPLPYGAPKVVD